MKKARAPLEVRFWAKVDRSQLSPGGCWIWTAAKNEHGYGKVSVGGRMGRPEKSHRVSLMLSGVDVTDRLVLHRCDNPPCVNPAHLYVGDHKKNTADMISRGRYRGGGKHRGSEHPSSLLNEKQVRTIRTMLASGLQPATVAEHFGISSSHVSMIKGNRIWKHVA